MAYTCLGVLQRQWLNAYHRRCLEETGDLLRESYPEAYQWLERRTLPIPDHPEWQYGTASLVLPGSGVLGLLLLPLLL